jgi:exodeoxyribonuclease V alpha subunit
MTSHTPSVVPAPVDVLGPFERLVVARLARIANESDAARIEVFAHVVRAVQEGHGCLTAALFAENAGVSVEIAEARLADAAESTLARPVTLAMPCAPDVTPFVADEQGRLYLGRHFDHQQALALRVREVAQSSVAHPYSPDAALLERLFPDGDTPSRRAALRVAQSALTVLTGGPGTGKTSTVVKVLALTAAAALAEGRPPPRAVLLAPTGKAAARLSESIAHALARLGLPDELRAAIETRASTVHRALGVKREGGFRHGPSRPLDAGIVVVDEASMVDLALMRALFDSVPAGARLVVLGDRDQLASVEAGSVLADLCDAAEAEGSRLAGALITLTTSHRFSDGSGIGRLARAIRDGDVGAALAALADPAYADVVLAPLVDTHDALPSELLALVEEGYGPLGRMSDEDSLAQLSRFRVLTPIRRGALGVEGLGARIGAALGRPIGARLLRGTPVLVLENAPEVSLSNGDVGVVVEVGTRGEEIAFEGLRRLGRSRLPRHEPSFAMSIHKSQGSEFDVVAVVLPERSPLSTRELLYTAITRAKSRVVVFASPQAIASAIGRRIVRASGLADALR